MPSRITMLLLGLLLAGCATESREPPRPDITSMTVTMLLATSIGDITVELDPVVAPISTTNVLEHARHGDYDGTIFHRVMPGFVVQGGGWTPDLKERAKADAAAGRPDTAIKNEWRNGLANQRGTIAMAREEAPDTATREFYINLKDNAKLDTARPTTGHAGYAVFGRVVGGWDIIERIAAGKTAPRQVEGVTDGSMENVPVDPVVIKRVVQVAGGVRPIRGKAPPITPDYKR